MEFPIKKGRAIYIVLAKSVTFGVCLAILMVLGVPQASASLVSVTGGFNGYSGLVGGCGQFHTSINGQDVTPTSGCDPSAFTAPLTLSFAATSSVTFFGSQFGTDLTHNMIAFTPAAPQDVAGVGSIFDLGTLSFTNGIWFGTNAAATFHITLTTVSSDPALNGKVLDDSITLFITPNDFSTPKTPAENADFIYFTSFSGIGSERVYELNDSPTGSNTGSGELFGKIGSLIPTSFKNPTGAAFIDAGVGAEPSAAVPEPGTIGLLGLGLLGLGMASRKRLKYS